MSKSAPSSPIQQVGSNVQGENVSSAGVQNSGSLGQKLMCLMSSDEVFAFIVSKVSGLQQFKNVWLLTGEQLLSFEPRLFIRAIQLELMSFPFSLGVEVFKLVQERIREEAHFVATAGIVHPSGESVVNAWISASVPSIQSFLSQSQVENIPERHFHPQALPAGVPQILSQVFTPRGINSPDQFSMQFPNQFPNQFSNQLSNQFAKPSKPKFVIGGPRTPFQNSLAANSLLSQANSNIFANHPYMSSNLAIQSLGQMVASASPSQFQGQMVASAAQTPQLLSQTVASAAPMLSSPMVASVAPKLTGHVAAENAQKPPNPSQMVASAAQTLIGQTAANVAPIPFNPNFNFDQRVASVAHETPIQRQLFSSPSQFTPNVTDANSFSLQGLLQNPFIAQLFQTVQAQAVKSKPIMPWEAAALADPFIQDPSMPRGYKRLSMATVIMNARAERLSNPSMVDTAKAIKWPKMGSFTKSEFIRVRKEYYECVQINQSGIISSFKSCMTLVARNSAMGVFELNDEKFGKLSDDTFMNWCALKFGPRNKEEAVKRLKSVKIFHRDGQGSMEEFLTKFDTVCYEHEIMVNDIVDSQYKWPFDVDDIDCSSLTEKEIAKEWRDLFPKQESSVFSVPLRKCRRFIEQNVEMPFHQQVRKLRAYFVDKNQDEEEDEEEESSRRGKNGSSFVKRDRPKVPGVAFSGLSNTPTHTGSSASKRSLSSGAVSKPKFVKKVVPGHARGLSCGSLNNHYGLGCSKDTCPTFGTEFDKSKVKAHVWKSSEDEPSVVLPNDMWNQRLKSNPKIQANWKQASHELRSKPKVKVAAFASKDEEEDVPGQDEIDELMSDVEEMRVESESSSDNEDEVNSSAYFDAAEAPGCHVAAVRAGAANISNPFVELGHEDQFYAVTRFAKNDEFRTRTLMDPGATINIISPMVANRSAIDRRQLAVTIFQGKRKMASVEEMVKCSFELMAANGTWQNHVEWFAVCDLGYDILLGRRFCRVQRFTSFDDKLMSFDSIQLPNSLAVAAFSVDQRLIFRFERVQAPIGEAKYKRKPKTITGLLNCDQNSIGKKLLTAQNALSGLKVLGRKNDVVDEVLLEFVVDTVDRKGSQLLQQWFRVTDGDDLKLSIASTSKLIVDVTRELAIKTICVERGVKEIKQAPAKPVELTESEIAQKKAAISAESQRIKKENSIRFASYHPIQGYRLQRNVERPPLRQGSKDHFNHYAQRDVRRDRAVVEEAVNAIRLEDLCKVRRRQYEAMLSALAATDSSSAHRGVSASVDCWMDELKSEKLTRSQRKDVEAAETKLKRQQSSQIGVEVEQKWDSVFKAGEYVEIVNAVVKQEYNGQRVRIFSQTDEKGVWVIRVLGKNEGKRRCSELLFKKLSLVSQQQSVPAGAQAGFDEVGIDENGQPNIEYKALAHRQFGAEYSEELTKRINLLKETFPKVFTTDVSEPCDFEPMKIRLIPNAVLPSKARFYRNTPKMREEVKRQIQEQLDWGAIVKCVTPCVSDVLLVKRPHMPGKFRFVVSYVKLNDATVKEQLLMPDPKSQHERLAGKKIFGALDFSSYYRQIRLHKDSQYLTGFASDEGTFCYTRVPMGITGACQYAQKVLQDALAEDPVLGPLGIRNYFDDLPFGADTEDEFMIVLEALLVFCEKWRLKVNPEKTVLGVTSITHVGFVVSAKGVAIDPERTRDIKELTAPKSIKKVQSVLGIFNYVRNFIEGFSTKAKFLTDKLGTVAVVKGDPAQASYAGKKRKAPEVAALSVAAGTSKEKVKVQQKFEWTQEDQSNFEALKECVLQAPLLEHLDYSLPIYIRCDASRFGCGAVLFQYDSRGYEHPVCYASRKFLPAERNWSTFSQEASTVVWALERFNEYTQGYHVIVECDHRNISFVKKSAMPQLARWRLRLQDMDFTVRYLSGPRNVCSDGLSRQHVDDIEVVLSDVIPECALPEEESTQQCAEIAALRCLNYSVHEARTAAFSVSDEERRKNSEGLEQTDQSMFSDADADDVMSQSSDSDDSDSAASDVDETIDLTEAGPDGTLLHVFGPNGELLNVDHQPIVREEPQPAHLEVPMLDAHSEIKAVHNDLVGHAGAYVTLQRALRNGRAWATRKQMLLDVDEFIRGCPCCQKMRKRSSHSMVDRHVLSGSPFSEISIDLLKLPKPDAYGMAYVVVIVDNFSHWTSLVAVRNKSVFEAARALVKVTGDFGVPLRVRSDGGKEFVNGVIAGLLRMMGATHHTVVPYTPQANGIVERANRSILERLRAMVFSDRLVRHTEHVWSDLLPLVQRSINASVHSATGTSPARIIFGDNLDLDRCLLTHMPNARELDVTRYVDALTFNQRIILEEADRHQSALCAKVVAEARKRQAKKNRNGESVELPFKKIQVNDWVLVSPSKDYPLHKLSPRWLGPFRVLECKDESEVVVIEDTLKQKVRKFLRRQLELFDISQVSSVEGLKKVAESDGFEFPVDAIVGHALIEEGGVGVSPVQLPPTFKRGVRPKKLFQFLIKWTGYTEPTWVEYHVASRLVQFPGYVAFLPNLRMD